MKIDTHRSLYLCHTKDIDDNPLVCYRCDDSVYRRLSYSNRGKKYCLSCAVISKHISGDEINQIQKEIDSVSNKKRYQPADKEDLKKIRNVRYKPDSETRKGRALRAIISMCQ